MHLAIFAIPWGPGAYGPGVPVGWPARFLFLVYMVWLITLARQAIEVQSKTAEKRERELESLGPSALARSLPALLSKNDPGSLN